MERGRGERREGERERREGDREGNQSTVKPLYTHSVTVLSMMKQKDPLNEGHP